MCRWVCVRRRRETTDGGIIIIIFLAIGNWFLRQKRPIGVAYFPLLLLLRLFFRFFFFLFAPFIRMHFKRRFLCELHAIRFVHVGGVTCSATVANLKYIYYYSYQYTNNNNKNNIIIIIINYTLAVRFSVFVYAPVSDVEYFVNRKSKLCLTNCIYRYTWNTPYAQYARLTEKYLTLTCV